VALLTAAAVCAEIASRDTAAQTAVPGGGSTAAQGAAFRAGPAGHTSDAVTPETVGPEPGSTLPRTL